jgi:hypothetical protein
MRKVLFVGDPHVKPDELEDCNKLFQLIHRIQVSEKVTDVVFLGDQYHTHGIMHVPVLAFYKKWFAWMAQFGDVTALVGNHDRAMGYDAHAMLAHNTTIAVIDKPVIDDPFLYIPYMEEPEEFIKMANTYPAAKVLICHQTFDGSHYANGFYDKNGIDPNRVPQPLIISGHIHTPQSFGKVIYVGAPRWLTMADANIDRALWLLTFDDEGKMVEQKSFDTAAVCSRIIHLVDSELQQTMPVVDIRPQDRATIDIAGTKEYITTRTKYWDAQGVERKSDIKIRTFPVPTQPIVVKESEGIATAFQKYIDEFKPPNDTPKEKLVALVQERLA